MKITAIETIRPAEFANLIFVRVHTDEGQGEGADTVSFQDFLKNISPADFKDN